MVLIQLLLPANGVADGDGLAPLAERERDRVNTTQMSRQRLRDGTLKRDHDAHRTE